MTEYPQAYFFFRAPRMCTCRCIFGISRGSRAARQDVKPEDPLAIAAEQKAPRGAFHVCALKASGTLPTQGIHARRIRHAVYSSRILPESDC